MKNQENIPPSASKATNSEEKDHIYDLEGEIIGGMEVEATSCTISLFDAVKKEEVASPPPAKEETKTIGKNGTLGHWDGIGLVSPNPPSTSQPA